MRAARFLEVLSRSQRALAALGSLVLAAAAAGCSGGSGVETSALKVGVERPKPPAPGAVVLAGESGSRAVALAVGRDRLTATVLAPSGDALSGLRLSFVVGSRVLQARPCGSGCYSASAQPARRIEVRPRGSRPLVFHLPASARPAAAIVARAGRAVRSLRSLVYEETLRSGPFAALQTTWRMVAPNQVEYVIRGGASAVVIGTRRWDRDRAGKPWRRSQQLPALRVPQPVWGTVATNAHVLGTGRVEGRPVWIVSFANPTTPAWFTAWIDRATYRPLRVRMTAAAHFMVHRYLAFNGPVTIRPPR
jgi:hypothetical protein